MGEPGEVTARPPAVASRLDIVDALRGSALLGILLLHAVEHWDFMRMPPDRPSWLEKLDGQTVSWAFWLLSGKAYAIFALMFGVSFFITLDSWRRKGDDAAATRFIWRMALLALLGYVHGLIYNGDILGPIALLGVPLVLLDRLRSRGLAVVAVLLLLQLPQWAEVLRVLAHPSWEPGIPRHWAMFGQAEEVFATGSLADVLRLNAWQGQIARWWWLWESWRWPQMLGLFACGLLLGRSGALHAPARLRRLAWWALIAGLAGVGLVWLAQVGIGTLGLQGRRGQVVNDLAGMYGNLAQAAVWAAGFALLYPRARRVLGVLVPYGRMSLTCYVTQALIGVPFFYAFGLGMYRHVGPFAALFFALAVVAVQCALAHAWLKRFAYGPLEWGWRAATLRTLQIPMRRVVPRPA
ncbi:DUF418 domain-containing protein [Roseateles sp. BYS78W]|uniref:DUF418 domain-containing protein n=1 Tax=Pelomonas candidula TaxID=3299025 RepID=A0ABW7HEW7_9BURK